MTVPENARIDGPRLQTAACWRRCAFSLGPAFAQTPARKRVAVLDFEKTVPCPFEIDARGQPALNDAAAVRGLDLPDPEVGLDAAQQITADAPANSGRLGCTIGKRTQTVFERWS